MVHASAKTTPPRVQGLVRHRLHAWLDAAPAAVWILGPAGAGKTTLASAYAATHPTIWYRIDPSDADPWSVFDNLRRATGKRSLPRPAHRGDLGIFASRFFASLYRSIGEDAVVILDDCHAIPDLEASGWSDLLHAAIRELPPKVRLLMPSRTEPPPRISSLVARQALAILGWPELGFDEAETAALLDHHPTTSWDPHELHRWTGGWPAGLALTLAASQHTRPLPPLEPGQPLFDFLSVEVYESLDPGLREVLAQTSLLPAIAPRAAIAVTGRDDAPRLLRQALRLGLCVEQLEDDDEAYRVHPLWAAFLRARLSPVEAAQLRARSALALEAEGEIEAAADLWIELGDHPRLADLCLTHAASRLGAGRGATVAHWLAALPTEQIATSGWLSYWHAIISLAGDPKSSVAAFERALTIFQAEADATGVALAWADGAQSAATIALSGPALRRWLALWSEMGVEACLVEVPQPIRARVAIAMTLLSRLLGDPRADGWAEQALTESREAGVLDVEVMAGAIASLHFGMSYELPRMERAMGRLEQLAQDPDHDPSAEPHVALASATAKALYTYLTADYAETCAVAVDALALADREGVHVWRDALLLYAIYGALGHGDLALAERMQAALAALPARGAVLDINRHLADALLDESRDQLVAAHRAATAAVAALRELDADHVGLGLALSAQAHLASQLGHLDEASDVADELEQLAAARPTSPIAYWSGMARAHLGMARGDDDDLRRGLTTALAIADRTGVPHLIFPRLAILAELLARALEAGIEPDHATRVITTLELPPPATIPLDWPRPTRVRTLGAFEVMHRGEPSVVGGAPARLLQALVAAGPDATAHGSLEDDLWPEAEGDGARRSLDTTLHRLRRELGREAVVFEQGNVAIDPRRCAVDAHAVERLAIALTATPSVEAAHRLLDAYRGEFLPQSDEPWAITYRTKLARRVSRAIQAALAQAPPVERAELHARALDHLVL
ncbi:MAG: hypothetical protein R3B72_08805 [Polyangiaceae bacterium]